MQLLNKLTKNNSYYEINIPWKKSG